MQLSGNRLKRHVHIFLLIKFFGLVFVFFYDNPVMLYLVFKFPVNGIILGAGPPLFQPLQQCCQHSCSTSISQRPLDMMLSICTQHLRSAMARPVLNGSFPVKLQYGLPCHRSFSGFGNLLIAWSIFM